MVVINPREAVDFIIILRQMQMDVNGPEVPIPIYMYAKSDPDQYILVIV